MTRFTSVHAAARRPATFRVVKARLDNLVLDTVDPEQIERLGGGWRDRTDHEAHGFRWRVMANPQGNEFCIFPARG